MSPFANINDEEKNIKVIFDDALINTLVWFHPCQNDNTVVLNMDWMEKYLEKLGVECMYLGL